jgi:hypothetical protein
MRVELVADELSAWIVEQRALLRAGTQPLSGSALERARAR